MTDPTTMALEISAWLSGHADPLNHNDTWLVERIAQIIAHTRRGAINDAASIIEKEIVRDDGVFLGQCDRHVMAKLRRLARAVRALHDIK